MIQGTTKVLGVIGDPIEHSLSPLMQNAAIAQLGVDAVYVPFRITPADLATAIAGFAAIGVQGFNITIPHKQAIIPFLSEISAIAQAVGAVNTVYRTETGWTGTNTDVTGFLAPLKALSQDWSTCQVVVLGNGGAARAVVAGCTQLGCAHIQVVGRNPEKLQAFQRTWQNSPIVPPLSVHTGSDLPSLLPQANLIVNATPLGMAPHIDASPLNAELWSQVSQAAIAYDLIYTPNPTRFLREATQQGAIAIDGLEMLVQQGAAALELWLQQPVPVEIMRQTLKDHLGLH